MEHNIALLLLGLALVLTTSSSLLVTSGSGREGNGEKKLSDGTLEPGEISGSMSLTTNGDLWLTIFVDSYSILAAIEVVEVEGSSFEYKFSVAGIAELTESSESSKTQSHSETPPEILFSTPEEASERLVQLIRGMGIELTPESIRSVPFAVKSGWRSPEKCIQFVKKLIDEHEEA
jgi:hypothetical protein